MAVYQFRNFIDADHCNRLIQHSIGHFEKAGVLGKPIEGYRVADVMTVQKDNPLVSTIVEQVAEMFEVPIENEEPPQLICYHVGGEYKVHHDYFHLGQDYTDEMMKMGGQRTHTFLIYLNDNFEGGETEFPKLDIKVTPEAGKALIWDNLREDGKPDRKSLHAGLPVISGQKYILVIWIRERKFEREPAS